MPGKIQAHSKNIREKARKKQEVVLFSYQGNSAFKNKGVSAADPCTVRQYDKKGSIFIQGLACS